MLKFLAAHPAMFIKVSQPKPAFFHRKNLMTCQYPQTYNKAFPKAERLQQWAGVVSKHKMIKQVWARGRMVSFLDGQGRRSSV
jgi:hypothetical protein